MFDCVSGLCGRGKSTHKINHHKWSRLKLYPKLNNVTSYLYNLSTIKF